MNGFRNILIPLDRSELAEQAVSVAASIARRSGGTIHVVSVEEPLPALALASDSLEVVTEAQVEDRQALADYLKSIGAAVRDLQGGKVETAVLQGSVAGALSKYTDDHTVDLMVMTTHGRRTLGRWLLGSVADAVLRQTRIPVLLLHPRDPGLLPEVKHILVALDGTIEKPVADAAAALGALYPKTRYTLIRVVEPPQPIMMPLSPYPVMVEPERLEHMQAEAQAYLDGVREKFESRGLGATCQVLVGGVATQVLRAAVTTQADCIVVGTHTRRGVERFVLGSEAERIVHASTLPVLIAPVGDQ